MKVKKKPLLSVHDDRRILHPVMYKKIINRNGNHGNSTGPGNQRRNRNQNRNSNQKIGNDCKSYISSKNPELEGRKGKSRYREPNAPIAEEGNREPDLVINRYNPTTGSIRYVPNIQTNFLNPVYTGYVY